MSLIILYEAREWSNLYLRDRLRSLGLDVRFLHFEDPALTPEHLSEAVLVVNRLYPSALQRGHERTYYQGVDFVRRLHEQGIPLLNSWTAMRHDFSKARIGATLTSHGIPTPRVYCRSSDQTAAKLQYPLIVKPDCGGRASWTHVIRSEKQLNALLSQLPPIEFIFQDYIESVEPWTLRVEVIGDEIFSILRRSIDGSGLSGLHLGSTYEVIPELDPAVADLIHRALRALDIRIAGVDVVIGAAGPYLIDINATPNYSKELIALLGRNPLDRMADLIHCEYQRLNATVMADQIDHRSRLKTEIPPDAGLTLPQNDAK